MDDALALELEPEQPDAAVRAVAELLASGEPERDPWWQAGLDAALYEHDLA
jgi:hypothetical protein